MRQCPKYWLFIFLLTGEMGGQSRRQGLSSLPSLSFSSMTKEAEKSDPGKEVGGWYGSGKHYLQGYRLQAFLLYVIEKAQSSRYPDLSLPVSIILQWLRLYHEEASISSDRCLIIRKSDLSNPYRAHPCPSSKLCLSYFILPKKTKQISIFRWLNMKYFNLRLLTS